MEKNTIGQFIAVLRKANGLTQQEVADRLNVSNKAVSRWERDECAPDISLLPAIAEMFGVTCDELLKGERSKSEESARNTNGKNKQKQIKSLVVRSVTQYKGMACIVTAVAAIGLICMLGISYGYCRPIIGFAVMLFFEVDACVLALLAINRQNSIKDANELFDLADESLQSYYYRNTGNYAFASACGIAFALIISFPLVLFAGETPSGVISAGTYIRLALPIAAAFVLTAKRVKGYFIYKIIGIMPEQKKGWQTQRQRMDIIQLVATLCAALVFAVPHFVNYPQNKAGNTLYLINIIAGLALLCGNIAAFAFFVTKQKAERAKLILPGIRNALTVIPILLTANYCLSEFIGYNVGTWGVRSIWSDFAACVIIWAVFDVVEYFAGKFARADISHA